MNPAWSVIVFTTLAGAAQGLVVVMALLGGNAGVPLLELALRLAVLLLLAGLGASFAHLGKPLRAWRAATMWRTSWLSREVIVLPLFTAVVALWALLGQAAPAWLPLLAVLLALLLWWCTAMIYACLRFVQEWAHWFTPLNYTLIGLASGGVLATALAALLDDRAALRVAAPLALLLTVLAAAARGLALRRNAGLVPKSTLQSATGLQQPRVVQVSMGMTGGSFNTREFFHGRGPGTLRHVKTVFVLAGFVLPALLLLWGLMLGGAAAFVVAALLQAPGVLAERWFFFAQARHPQNLYYQRVS